MLQDSEAKVLVTTEAMSKKLAFTGTVLRIDADTAMLA